MLKLFVLFGVVCPLQEKINMSKSQYKAKHVKGESRSQHKLCVPPCKHYMSAGDTHSLQLCGLFGSGVRRVGSRGVRSWI